MVARKRLKEIEKAKSQKIQERVHQILYCDTVSKESGIYRQRFTKIIKRSNITEEEIKVEEDLLKEYRKRVERKLKGKEPLDKSLVFYRILNILNDNPMTIGSLMSELGHSKECIEQNLLYLEKSGLVEKSIDKNSLLPKGRKLITRTM